MKHDESQRMIMSLHTNGRSAQSLPSFFRVLEARASCIEAYATPYTQMRHDRKCLYELKCNGSDAWIAMAFLAFSFTQRLL